MTTTTIREEFGNDIAIDWIVIVEDETDEMDAPADWDAGNVTFDPYV